MSASRLGIGGCYYIGNIAPLSSEQAAWMLHIQRENSMKYLPTRKKCVRGSTRPEIEIRKSSIDAYQVLMVFGMTDNFPKVIKEIF